MYFSQTYFNVNLIVYFLLEFNYLGHWVMCLLFYMKRKTYCTTKLTQGALVKLLSSTTQSITTKQASSSIWLIDLPPFLLGEFWNLSSLKHHKISWISKEGGFEILWTFSIIFEEKGVKTLVGCIEKLRVGEKTISKKRKGEKNTSWKGYSSYKHIYNHNIYLWHFNECRKSMLS